MGKWAQGLRGPGIQVTFDLLGLILSFLALTHLSLSTPQALSLLGPEPSHTMAPWPLGPSAPGPLRLRPFPCSCFGQQSSNSLEAGWPVA